MSYLKSKGLNSSSSAYYDEQKVYEQFSKAEDMPKKIEAFLKKHVCGKRILDAGCGSGKFLPLLEILSREYVGIDLSKDQIKEARKKKGKENSIVKVGDLEHLPFEAETFDVIISPWVIGTIIDLEKREKVVQNLKRLLKKKGKIYLIENASTGEFEEIRNHHLDGKTKEYNDWLLKHKFQVVERINTYFEFHDLEEAKNVFEKIYGKEVSQKIQSKKIEHNVLIYQYE